MGQRIPQTVGRFLRRVHARWRLERAILFGSRARGDWLVNSDWDLILVSPDFAPIPFVERPRHLWDLWPLPQDVELLCYTPEELARKARQIGLVRNALREGIELLPPRRQAA